ncbi:hypothetical protein HYS47_04105, partial [Candidatus Woesearchaeota archaeon]|nr:hypothetical protein [Candidatus Woesearchaeota archaeon]
LDLIKKYEEEIDRNKLLMEKSIISTLVFNRPQKVKTVHLYYITGIAKHLEGIADLLLFIDKKERQFLQNVIEKIDHLKELLGDMSHVEQFQYQTAIAFCKDINAMKETSITSVQAYHQQRIKEHFVAISEILMDMAMTNEIQE